MCVREREGERERKRERGRERKTVQPSVIACKVRITSCRPFSTGGRTHGFHIGVDEGISLFLLPGEFCHQLSVENHFDPVHASPASSERLFLATQRAAKEGSG